MEKPQSITPLLQFLGVSLEVGTVQRALILAGLVREVTYSSTTGSGETKSYLQLTEEGLVFGTNVKTQFHEFRTQLAFYPSSFVKVLRIVVDQLSKEVQALEKLGSVTFDAL